MATYAIAAVKYGATKMENTISNAEDFYLLRKKSSLTPFISATIAEIMVAYAATIRPAAEVVVRVPKQYDHHEWESDLTNAEVKGRNDCLSELRRLNPTLTFTDETKSK